MSQSPHSTSQPVPSQPANPKQDVAPTLSSEPFRRFIWCRGQGFDLGIDFRFRPENGTVDAVTRLAVEHSGAPGQAHGGVVAAIMDEAQGTLCYHLGHWVMTDKLNMEYKLATPIGSDIRIVARITQVRSRRLYSEGWIEDGEGKKLVTSTAKWYLLGPGVQARLKNNYPANDWVQLSALMQANQDRRRAWKRSRRS